MPAAPRARTVFDAMASQTPLQPLLAKLAREFDPVLLQFFRRRVRDPLEAEDLTQEVYVRLIRRGNLHTLHEAKAYLFETAANVLRDRARRRKARHRDEEDEFDALLHGETEFSSDEVLIGKETLTRVTRAILELPERARTIFVLRRLEGLAYKDIADRLNISLSLVEKEMRRAVAYLTQRMGEE